MKRYEKLLFCMGFHWISGPDARPMEEDEILSRLDLVLLLRLHDRLPELADLLGVREADAAARLVVQGLAAHEDFRLEGVTAIQASERVSHKQDGLEKPQEAFERHQKKKKKTIFTCSSHRSSMTF